VYFGQQKSIEILFTIHSNKGKAEEKALVDSGATGNFIDYSMVKRLSLGTKKLDKQRTVANIDGTLNRSGTITWYCKLLVSQGGKQKRENFFITSIGRNRWIFGYPWLYDFKPMVNWKDATIAGPHFLVQTLVHGKFTQQEFLQHIQATAITQMEEGDELIMSMEVLEPEPMRIRKTTLAQQMAEKAYDATKVNTEATIPTVFK